MLPEEAWIRKCPLELSELKGLTGADAARAHAIDAEMYFDCATRHNRWVDFELKQQGRKE